MRFVFLIFFSLSLYAGSDFIKQAYYDSYNYEKMQNYPDAIKALQVVYEKYPKAYTPNFRIAWLFFLNKNYTNSIKHYKLALSVIPGSVEAKLGLAQVFNAQEKYDDSIRVAYDILQNDLYNYYANLHLVTSLNAKKEYEQSLKIIYKMLASYPTDVKYLSFLADIYVQQNKNKLAKSIYSDILILDPVNPNAISFLNRKQ